MPSRQAKRLAAAGIALAALIIVLVTVAITRNPAQEAVAALEPAKFVEEAALAGVSHVYDGEFTFFVGGGVAVLDCDGDRKPDLFMAGGTKPSSLYRNESEVAGSLRFSAVAAADTSLTEVVGAYPINIDGDEHLDLAVLRLGENVLLRGVGDCRFERANELWSIDGGDEWTAAFSAKWEPERQFPTIAFGNYLALDEAGQQFGGCSDNVLFRPEASRYDTGTILSPGWCTLSILFSDWDRSGNRDLRITNDRQYYRDGEEQLWAVAAGQDPRLYTPDDGWQRIQIFGMGIASQDITGDGLPELFLTSMGDNKLQSLTNGSATRPVYEDIALGLGATAHRPFIGSDVLPSTAWHAEFQDVNNDSFMDLYVSKGNVDAMSEFAAEDPNNLLLGMPDGTFSESAVEAGLLNVLRTRGAALADFNLDGLLDVIEVNRRDNVTLWRNVGWGTEAQPKPMGNWAAIRLEQPLPNRDAVGAWIEVRVGDRTVERELTIGGGHASGHLGWIHFGLGLHGQADIRVRWPDGELGPWMELASNSFATLIRGETEPRTWVP